MDECIVLRHLRAFEFGQLTSPNTQNKKRAQLRTSALAAWAGGSHYPVRSALPNIE